MRMSTVDQLVARAVRQLGHWVLVVQQAGLGVFAGQRAMGLLEGRPRCSSCHLLLAGKSQAAQMQEGAATSWRGAAETHCEGGCPGRGGRLSRFCICCTRVSALNPTIL